MIPQFVAKVWGAYWATETSVRYELANRMCGDYGKALYYKTRAVVLHDRIITDRDES